MIRPSRSAARKLLALFDRAEARDFVDIHALSDQFDLTELLGLAHELDDGFTAPLLAEMLGSHRRFTDEDFVALGGDPSQLRAFVEKWRAHLAGGGG